MNGTTISYIFVGAILLLTVIGLLKGLDRGVARQTVRTATIAVSVVLSLIVTRLIVSSLSDLCAGKTLEELVLVLGLNEYFNEETMNLFGCFDATVAERIIDLPLTTVIMPFVFTLSFILISAILLIVHAIICAICRFYKKKKTVSSRLIGMAIGAVQGFAVSIIFVLPVVSLLGLTHDAQDIIRTHHPEEAEDNIVCNIYDDYLKETYENPLFAVASSLGGDMLCDSFATVEMDGESVNLRDKFSLIIGAVDDFAQFAEYDWANPTEEQLAALEGTVDKLAHDKYAANILSGGMRGIATAVDTGVIELQLEEPVLGVMKNLITIFTTLNEDNFGRDIDTILDVYLILASEGILDKLSQSNEDITAAFIAKNEDGETVITRIITTIQDNPHIKPLVTMLTKLSVSIMMNDVGIENGEEVYDSVKDGINEVIAIKKDEYETPEEYKEAVSESLDETLRDHDIVLAPEIVDTMADYVSENYSELEEITDDEINDTILSYYEAYLEYIENGGDNPFPELDMGGGGLPIPEAE